eukprot:TRINITY_DN95905_c0_g1_i1.p1 TRINITY_DN95905_c0_g1~~TRINITY_DN95905_c0_g1_i1.p1  ORF type:complete len:193 (+),score=51.58 TRINITY_DN95905_c0_g1_i1:27-581(+)
MVAMARADEDVDMEIITDGARLSGSQTTQMAPPWVSTGGLADEGCEVNLLGGGEDFDEDIPVDFQDIWAGAVGGVPVHERSFIAPECVAGVKKVSQKSYIGLLKDMSRIDGKLLQSRLSHLAEGEYDLNGDVVRPRGVNAQQLPSTMAVDQEASNPGCVFHRRQGAQGAKANARRRKPDEDDDA